MEINILGKAVDLRTNTPVIYAQMSINDYLDLIGSNFDEFSIQRKREKHKAYSRMKDDIVAGALLPPITLAINPTTVPVLLEHYSQNDMEFLKHALSEATQVKILDGLQRTFILKELATAGTPFKTGQNVLVEFWLESEMKNLIYRIIVLNAGQKPMSMRHQIDVLFATLKETLEGEIERLELFPEKDESRRTKPRKYALDRIVTAYHSFLSRSPEIQRDNIIAQKLVDEDILSESEETLNEKYNNFKKYLLKYTELDDEICRVYEAAKNSPIPSGLSWFGSENTMNSFFAAIAVFGVNPGKINRIDRALDILLTSLQSAVVKDDPLQLGILQDIIQGFNIRKVNVGFATRKLLTNSFKEFFREEGEKPLGGFWTSEAE